MGLIVEDIAPVVYWNAKCLFDAAGASMLSASVELWTMTRPSLKTNEDINMDLLQ
jgi:hypothetical protein